MKTLMMFSLILGISTGVGAAAIDQTVLVPVETADAYEGSGDTIVVDVEGYLPNECYSEPEITVQKSALKNRINVRVHSYVSDGPCAQVIVPYDITESLGMFPEGSYEVVFQPGTEWETRDYVVVD